jgi:hypothetical protein
MFSILLYFIKSFGFDVEFHFRFEKSITLILEDRKYNESESLSYLPCACSLLCLIRLIWLFGETFDLEISKDKVIEKGFEGDIIEMNDEVYFFSFCYLII